MSSTSNGARIKIIIYADGSSLGNPGPGGWGAVIVYDDNLKFKIHPSSRAKLATGHGNLKVTELGGGDKHTTNNRMELTAVIQSLFFVARYKLLTTNYKLVVRTDSRYVINGITKWIKGWQKSGWIGKNKKPILNKDLWLKIDKLTEKKDIKWEHVHGHVGIVGNERADFIATACAKEKQFKTKKFFDSPIDKYPFDILSIKETKKKSVSKSNLSDKKSFSYLSLVGGVLMRHNTWPECEKRVKGVSGARFKKALSKEDEEKIIREWKVSQH